MPSGVVNRIRAHVRSGLLLLPKRGAEVGGILLGRVVSTHPLTVHIADFEPVPCEYRYGPTFILSDRDLANFESLLATHSKLRNLSIIGYFRSCTGRAHALDDADLELMRTWFPGPESVVLSLKPLSLTECEASFFVRENGVLPTLPTHPALPFNDRQTADLPLPAPLEAPVALSLIPIHHETPVAGIVAEPEPPAPAESITEPPFEQPLLPPPAESGLPLAQHRPPAAWRARYSIILALMLLIAAAAGYYAGKWTRPPRLPLPSPKVAVGTPSLPPLVIPALAPPKAPVPVVPASLIEQAEPDISPGIRARIQTPIVINVEVRIDLSGKVIGAAPQGDGDSVFRFLAEQAAFAARASKFRPARAANGSSVPSAAMLSFTFEPPPR